MLKIFQNKLHAISQQALENFHEGVLMFDEHFNIIFSNSAMEDILGYSPDELVDRHVNDIIPKRFHAQNDFFASHFSSDLNMIGDALKKEHSRKIHALDKNKTECILQISLLKCVVGRQFYVAMIKSETETQRQEEENLKLSLLDPSTGILNKKEFMMRASKEHLRFQRYNNPFSILVLEILYSDRVLSLDHSAQDRLLKSIALLCKDTLRNIDIIGRLHENKFILLLPETTAENATIIANRLLSLIEKNKTIWENETLTTTASAGIADDAESSLKQSLEELIQHAQIALDSAKKEGLSISKIYDK